MWLCCRRWGPFADCSFRLAVYSFKFAVISFFDSVGSTVNPEASLRWQPVETVPMRASVESGFRAARLVDLYSPEARSITTNGSRDLIRYPPGTTGLVDCSTQFVTIGGGNSTLKPEKSKSATIELLCESTKNYSIGLNYFLTKVNDAIRTGLLTATILADPVI